MHINNYKHSFIRLPVYILKKIQLGIKKDYVGVEKVALARFARGVLSKEAELTF